MYSLSTIIESQTWDNLEDMLEELHANERTIPCGIILDKNGKVEFTNTFELLKAVQERIELKQQTIRYSLFNIDFETNKVIATIKDYVLSYKG